MNLYNHVSQFLKFIFWYKKNKDDPYKHNFHLWRFEDSPYPSPIRSELLNFHVYFVTKAIYPECEFYYVTSAVKLFSGFPLVLEENSSQAWCLPHLLVPSGPIPCLAQHYISNTKGGEKSLI